MDGLIRAHELTFALGCPQQVNLAMVTLTIKHAVQLSLNEKGYKIQTTVTHSVVPALLCRPGCSKDLLEQFFTAKKDTKCPFSLPPTANYKTSSKKERTKLFLSLRWPRSSSLHY